MISDLPHLFIWWGVFFVVGLATYPTTYLFFRKFFDAGWGFSKSIGLLILSYLFFIVNILQVIPFTRFFVTATLIAIALVNYILFLKNKTIIISGVKKSLRVIVAQEILFAVGLFFWSYVRSHQPDIVGLEKLMDIGFINSILRTTYLPPADMWFAGSSINYYWFGHFMVSVATKLSGISSSVTYNLMLATILGLTLNGAFSISATITKSLGKLASRKAIVAAGLISAVLLTFGGNLHALVYTYLDGPDTYWYPDATRFIGYNPDVADKTIHEFPMYSFVVSDLHAHLINLPIVLIYIGVLVWIFLPGKKKGIEFKYSLPLGFLLGVMFMTNAWDTANYLLLTGISILVFNVYRGGVKIKPVVNTAKIIIPAITIAAVVVFPFLTNFESIAEGVGFVNARSRIWQLAVLWGFPAVLSAIYIWSIRNKKLNSTDLLISSILATVWVLITIPEFIYVKDIYIASHHRANTMFKLTYQAFVMAYILSGYIVAKVIVSEKKFRFRVIKKLLLFAVLSSVLIYPKYAIGSYYNDFKNYKGLDGSSWLSDRYSNVASTVDWFNKNVDGQPVILEAPGDSYTDYNVISSYTGLPTVSGWFVHEWLWRGDSSFPQARVSDISIIYTSGDVELTKGLLEKYNVEYVIIGHFEREKYPNLIENKFKQIGEVVFSSGNTSVYKTD